MVQIEGSVHVKRRPAFLLNRAGCQWCLTWVDEAQKLTAAQLQNNSNHSQQQLGSKWSPCATAIPDTASERHSLEILKVMSHQKAKAQDRQTMQEKDLSFFAVPMAKLGRCYSAGRKNSIPSILANSQCFLRQQEAAHRRSWTTTGSPCVEPCCSSMKAHSQCNKRLMRIIMQSLGCVQWKKKGVFSLELVILIISIHLTNAIPQTVHMDLSQQGEMTRPPWHSCFNPSPEMQVHGKGNGNHLLLVESLLPMPFQCWVRTGRSTALWCSWVPSGRTGSLLAVYSDGVFTLQLPWKH